MTITHAPPDELLDYPPEEQADDDSYPAEDDAMPESDKHATQMMNLVDTLRRYFAARPDVFVGGNIFLYYERGNKRKVVGPDVLVAIGVRPLRGRRRNSYLLWREGMPPAVIIELTSESTWKKDVDEKPQLYATLGVREYYLFDPLNEVLKPALQGYHLNALGEYERLPGSSLYSHTLGLELVIVNDWLRLRDPQTRRLLPTSLELAQELAAAQAEITRLQAELARLRGPHSNGT